MTERKTLYYIFSLTILITTLVSYFVVYPLIKKIDSTKKEFQNKQGELEQLIKKEKNLKELEINYRNFKEQIDLITKMFPKTKEVSDYITQIETASSQNNTFVKSIKIATKSKEGTKEKIIPQLTQLVKNEDIYELNLELVIESKFFENIVNLLRNLENLSRFTTIKKVSVKTLNNGNTQEAIISINIYVSP